MTSRGRAGRNTLRGCAPMSVGLPANNLCIHVMKSDQEWRDLLFTREPYEAHTSDKHLPNNADRTEALL